MYSYGWREYMPDIGRWNAIDQLAESYLAASPYAYVLNNPVNMFDPDGRISESFIANIMGFPSCTSFHNNNDGSWGINGGSMAVNDNGVLLSGHSAGGGSSFMGWSVAGTIELPGVTLNGYGSANHWGGAISTYNINHSILYNGIAGTQAAWNYSNRPLDPMAWVRTDGPVQMIGGTGDPVGLFDVGGQVISNWQPQNRYLAMAVGIIGAVALKKPGLVATEINAETRVFRAVNDVELASIQSTRKFFVKNGLTEAKYFAKSLEDAHLFGKQLYPEGYTVVEGIIYNSNNPMKYWSPGTDGIGAFIFNQKILKAIKPIIK